MPARHYGSVDVFLEALGRAAPGDVLLVDNAGRADEACIGDLDALECQAAGLAGVVVWLHATRRSSSVFADEDGVLFVAADRAEEELATAREIWGTPRRRGRPGG